MRRLETAGLERPHTVTSTHNLLTALWTTDVERFEAAVARFAIDRPLGNDCQVAFFELAGDGELHVNVTHQYPTRAERGWAGPGKQPDGFVYNRRFGDGAPREIIRHIRNMVFAPRDRSNKTGTAL
jgi:hypothetical protein